MLKTVCKNKKKALARAIVLIAYGLFVAWGMVTAISAIGAYKFILLTLVSVIAAIIIIWVVTAIIE